MKARGKRRDNNLTEESSSYVFDNGEELAGTEAELCFLLQLTDNRYKDI